MSLNGVYQNISHGGSESSSALACADKVECVDKDGLLSNDSSNKIAIKIQNGDNYTSGDVESISTTRDNRRCHTANVAAVTDSLCGSDGETRCEGSADFGIFSISTTESTKSQMSTNLEWCKPPRVTSNADATSSAIHLLSGNSSVIPVNDVILTKTCSFDQNPLPDETNFSIGSEKSTNSIVMVESILPMQNSDLNVAIPSNIFSDDLLQISKINPKPTVMPDLDKIDSLELENLHSSLDLSPNPHNPLESEEIRIVVTNKDEVMLIPNDVSNIVVKNVEIIQEDEAIKQPQAQNLRQMNTIALPSISNSLEDVTNNDWNKCLNDINLQIVDQSAANILQPIHDDSGDVTGYYLIQPSGDIRKLFDATHDEPTAQEHKRKPADGGDGARLVCDACGKVYRKRDRHNYNLHKMTHSGERPFKCMMPYCKWAFTTFYKLKRHIESHEGRKDYRCPVPDCGRKFTTPYNLKYHQKTHEKPLPEVCTQKDCGMRFPSKRLLYQHVKSHADADKSFKCPFEGCGKLFYSQHCMGAHRRTHLYSRDQLTCQICAKVFPKLSTLKIHQRTHSGDKPFSCSVQGCDWSFYTASKLNRHMVHHSHERSFKCSVPGCEKTFKRKEHLRSHESSHDAQYTCTYPGCSSTFTTKAGFTKHANRHENHQIYHCPIENCPKFFDAKSSVRHHINRQHRNSRLFDATSSADTPLVPMSVAGEVTRDVILTPRGSVTSEITLLACDGTSQSVQQPDQTHDSTNSHPELISTQHNPPRLSEMCEDGDALRLESLSTPRSFGDAALPSHGIAFRDPETGIVYVQTQLLQDDPPNGELFPSATTINLHDLQ